MTRRLIIAFFVLALITALPPIGRSLAIVTLILFGASRVAFLRRGFVLLGRDIMCAVVPGLVPSENGSGSEGPGSATEGPLLGSSMPQNEETELLSTATLLISRHNLDARHACDLLAVLRNENGDYLLSAGKIRDIVGGNNAKVLGWVREMRPETQPTPQAGDPEGYTRNSDGYLVKAR